MKIMNGTNLVSKIYKGDTLIYTNTGGGGDCFNQTLRQGYGLGFNFNGNNQRVPVFIDWVQNIDLTGVDNPSFILMNPPIFISTITDTITLTGNDVTNIDLLFPEVGTARNITGNFIFNFPNLKSGRFFPSTNNNNTTPTNIILNVNEGSLTSCNYLLSTNSTLNSVNLFDTSNVTNFNSMFYSCLFTNDFIMPNYNTSNGTSFSLMFSNSRIKTIPQFDTSKARNMDGMFNGASSLESLPALDCSSIPNVSGVSNIFGGTKNNFTDFGGLINIRFSYVLSTCPNLTVDSLMNCINGLADLTGSSQQTLTLGFANISKLSDEQKQIATNKNWRLA